MKYLILMIVVTLLINTKLAQVGASPKLEYRQVFMFLQQLTPGGYPGVQYIIVDKEKAIFEHCTGFADLKKGIPLTPNHTMAAF